MLSEQPGTRGALHRMQTQLRQSVGHQTLIEDLGRAGSDQFTGFKTHDAGFHRIGRPRLLGGSVELLSGGTITRLARLQFGNRGSVRRNATGERPSMGFPSPPQNG